MKEIEANNQKLFDQYLQNDINQLNKYKIFGFGSIDDVLNFTENTLQKSFNNPDTQRKLFNLLKDQKLFGIISDIVMTCKHLRQKTNGDFASFMKDYYLLNRLTSLHHVLNTARTRMQ